ncbi:histidine phosphatase family protein [Petroclostridium sp. X23]|uniref:histidine phosphatase family protein n=1 Tax=Petroclostridium sp. X23 TaxID=3045146 RepID=UPI0024ACDA79|nr:histidine phosphatase family protein [Petroclostridium sp. X23]WHH58655.1 histidine phosphatase family protein [Petroclostridium sp. X23]
MDKTIYLIRHGEIDYGTEKRYIGTTDLPLSTGGIKQIGRLKEYFGGIRLEKAYISPLKRCVQTSDIILEDRNIERIPVNGLREISMGDWENFPLEYIRNRFSEQYERRGENIDVFVPPGGESFEHLQKRVMPAFENIIKSTTESALVVAHAGVNRVILSKLLGYPLKEILKIGQPYGCINQLHWDGRCQRWLCETICLKG